MKHAWTVLIVIVIVVVAGICGYILFAHKATQTVLPLETATSTAPMETYGMSYYIDSAYAFTFWYPTALGVTATTTNDRISFPGGVAVQTLQIGPMGGTSIVVVNSPSSTITDEPANHASPIGQTKYTYSSGHWIVSHPQGAENGISTAPAPANLSQSTISGLPMLPSGKRFDTTIIPLSTVRFLVISDGGGSSFTSELAHTVTDVDDTINSSTLSAALQAESAAYDRSQEK